QIEENLKIASEAYPDTLTEAEIQLVKRVEQKYRELMKTGCTGCRYCLPCPSGVDIPGCFEIYDNFYLSGNEKEAKLMYAAKPGAIIRGGVLGYASQCVQCGQCAERCPQHLDIPSLLEAVVEKFEGKDHRGWRIIAKKAFGKE
ncbi:aldo/keto reductase, partial [Methanosarcina sp. MSH10X1]|uniref:4Fe-4S dicluster domain-containing protein n=1 Tax=Methanosarcina sp. MSH10X1 TaxID=2507075 RepID=UPI001024FE08